MADIAHRVHRTRCAPQLDFAHIAHPCQIVKRPPFPGPGRKRRWVHPLQTVRKRVVASGLYVHSSFNSCRDLLKQLVLFNRLAQESVSNRLSCCEACRCSPRWPTVAINRYLTQAARFSHAAPGYCPWPLSPGHEDIHKNHVRIQSVRLPQFLNGPSSASNVFEAQGRQHLGLRPRRLIGTSSTDQDLFLRGPACSPLQLPFGCRRPISPGRGRQLAARTRNVLPSFMRLLTRISPPHQF